MLKCMVLQISKFVNLLFIYSKLNSNLYPSSFVQFKDGAFLISSSQNLKTKSIINFKRSSDNGSSWSNVSSYSAINKGGGDFFCNIFDSIQ